MTASASKRALRRAAILVALCLLTSGCGTVAIGITNSPDWCPNPRSTAPCP